VLLTACSAPSPKQLRFENIASPAIRVWPAEPEVARYEYIGQLTGEENYRSDSGESGMTGFLHWLVGLDGDSKQHLVLQRPQGGITDKEGRLFITDVSRRAVFVFDTVEGELKVWEWAARNTRFSAPTGIVQDKQGHIFVSDAELARVFRLDKKGQPVAEFGRDLLKRPTGLAYDAESQRFFVADTRAHDIKVFDQRGQLLDVIGHRGVGKGEFNGPTYLTFARGRLYVTDTLNARVQVFDRYGEHLFSVGERGLYLGNLTRPKGVAVDAEDNIYIIESYYDHLLVYDKQGRFLIPIGGAGKGVGQFFLPAGVWTDARNRVFIADMFNGRVVVLQYLGAKK